MKFLKVLVIIIVVIIALFLIVSAFLPSDIDVNRTETIEAPKSVVFEQVNNLKNWDKWSPWHMMDTNAVFTVGEKFKGEGATYKWESELEELGSGEYTILESYPYDSIKTEISFADGVKSNGYWYFKDEGDKTEVTWGVKGDVGFLSRWVTLFVDSWMGPMFERGLDSLKNASKNAKIDLSIEVTNIDPIFVLAIRDSIETDKISDQLQNIYGEVSQYMQNNNIQFVGPPIAMTHDWTEDSKVWKFSAGFPMRTKDVETEGSMYILEIPGGKVVKAKYRGPYEKMEPVYNQIMAYIQDNGLQIRGDSWELYLNDPRETKPEDLMTYIFFPVE